jgi:flagellar biogenesis protein FliO
MNEPGDRPSPPESKEPSKSQDAHLPPRVREALEKAEAAPAKRSPVGAIVGIVAVVLIAVGVWWLVQFNQAKARAAVRAVEAAAARAVAVADSIARIRTADSLRVVARADSIAAFRKLPKWRQNQILRKTQSWEPNPAEEGTFVLDAGSFLYEAPANAAATALKRKTKLDVRVVPVAVGGDTSFHVYVGRFGFRGEAQDAANDLLARGLTNQAKVVSLAKSR